MSADTIVAGATGALGSAICSRLRDRGQSVRALSRPETDLTRSETLRDAVEGARCVVSTATCFPRDDAPGAIDRVDRDGNIALIEAAEAAGAERFVFVSFRPVPLDFPLQRAKRAVEERLARSPLETVMLRPGKFMDIWFSPLCGFDVAARRATVFGDGTSPLTWIARDDVAELAALVAIDDAPPPVVELGGPEALSQREAIAVFEEAMGAPFALEHVSAEELDRQRREAPNELVESLSALMLEMHLGAVTDMTPVLDRWPVQLTSIREFAAQAASAH